MADAGKTAPHHRKKRTGAALGGIALTFGIGIGALYFFSIHQVQGKQASPPPPAAIPVQTATVMTRDIPIERSGLGVVSPLTRVDVKARVDGAVDSLVFVEGKDVSAGDVLARIDPRPYEMAVDQAQANYHRDLAQLNAARIEEARAKKLINSGSGTTQASDTAAAQVAILVATAEGSKQALEKAKLDLSYATVRAPVSGRAGLRQVDQGAVVRTSDQTGVVTLTQMRPIAVNFTLTQDDLPDLVAGQSAAPLAVSVLSRDGSKRLAVGTLSVIDSQVDSSTGMVKLKATFPNEDLALWPGELVTARILLRTDANSTVVSSAAIQNGQTGPYLWIVKPDGSAVSASIKTGPSANGMTAINGAKVGDTIVTAGQSRLTEGVAVSATAAASQKIASSQQEAVR